jgi:exodeoxyribonuclease VII large subunit
MEKTPISVSETVALINQTLEYALPVLVVEGEVSSFKVNQGKYVFFDLKDEESSLGCFMTVWQLRMPLEDGMKVRVVATPKLTAWGKFSLTVREVRPVGEGSLKRSFELLKAKLEKEGLFDEGRKRPLPRLPHSVGLIASTESAGYVDFLTILGSRWGGMEVSVAHVQVQGVGAAEQLVRAVEYFNALDERPEVLVVVRGGGSADDLAVFNDEPLVRAIAASKIPTLVGIGHEVDVSLVDLAADVRAATPSNAAEILVPDKREIMTNVQVAAKDIGVRFDRRLERLHDELLQIKPGLDRSLKQRLIRLQDSVIQKRRLLETLNPVRVLKSGYTLLRAADGKPVSTKGQAAIKKGDELKLELNKRILGVGVTYVEEK